MTNRIKVKGWVNIFKGPQIIDGMLRDIIFGSVIYTSEDEAKKVLCNSIGRVYIDQEIEVEV